MKKQILNLGKGLSKAEQKVIHGGDIGEPALFKCCWANDPNNCSECAERGDGSQTFCVDGALVTAC